MSNINSAYFTQIKAQNWGAKAPSAPPPPPQPSSYAYGSVVVGCIVLFTCVVGGVMSGGVVFRFL